MMQFYTFHIQRNYLKFIELKNLKKGELIHVEKEVLQENNSNTIDNADNLANGSIVIGSGERGGDTDFESNGFI